MKALVASIVFAVLPTLSFADCEQKISSAETVGQVRDSLRCLSDENAQLKKDAAALKAQVDKLSGTVSNAVSANGGRIYIGSSCFMSRQIIRCSLQTGSGDHMTWIDNADECARARGVNEGSISILAAC